MEMSSFRVRVNEGHEVLLKDTRAVHTTQKLVPPKDPEEWTNLELMSRDGGSSWLVKQEEHTLGLRLQDWQVLWEKTEVEFQRHSEGKWKDVEDEKEWKTFRAPA